MQLSLEEFYAMQMEQSLYHKQIAKLKANPPIGSLPELAEKVVDGIPSLTPDQAEMVRTLIKGG